MTEKQRMDKFIDKVQRKYPDIVNKDELLDRAIKEDQKSLLLKAIGWFFGGIVSLIVAVIISSRNSDSDMGVLFMIMGGSAVLESIRKFSSLSRVSRIYRPVVVVRDEGYLTREKILKDVGRKLNKDEGRFVLMKASLADKEDEIDTGTDNEVYHSYNLIFNVDGCSHTLKVKKSMYNEAVIDMMYYLVFTATEGTLVKAYPCTNLKLDDDLISCCLGIVDGGHLTESVQVAAVVKKEKPKKLLPALAIVLSIVAFFLPFILALPLTVAALVLAIVSIVKSRNGWSITSLIISILMVMLLGLYLVFSIIGLI